MLILTAKRLDGTVDVLIALAKDNIDRIREYDPAEVIWAQLPAVYSQAKPHVIAVTYVTVKEEAEITSMASSGKADWQVKAFRMLTRGWKYRPESGDHDFGPARLGKPTES